MQQPAGIMDSRTDKWIYVLFLPVFVALFLLFFQPFGVNNYDPTHTLRTELLLGVSIFALTHFFILSFNEFVLEPLFFKGKSWLQLFVWMLWSLFLISSSTFLVYNLLGGFHDWQWASYLGFLRDVSGTTLIPISILFLFYHNRNVQARLLALQLEHQRSAVDNGLVYFESENSKERFAIHWNQLLFLESQDNYVAVHYRERSEVRRKLIRHTLKKLEREFAGSPLIRCHRSFMANMSLAVQAEGNAHQLKLTLEHCTAPLPVSRKYVPKVHRLLKQSTGPGQSSLISEVHPSSSKILDWSPGSP